MRDGVNVVAIPAEGRLLRCVRRQQEFAAHAALLERIARETGGNITEERRHAATPADTRTLRGLPAAGRGVAGVIAGTQPGAGLFE